MKGMKIKRLITYKKWLLLFTQKKNSTNQLRLRVQTWTKVIITRIFRCLQGSRDSRLWLATWKTETRRVKKSQKAISHKRRKQIGRSTGVESTRHKTHLLGFGKMKGSKLLTKLKAKNNFLWTADGATTQQQVNLRNKKTRWESWERKYQSWRTRLSPLMESNSPNKIFRCKWTFRKRNNLKRLN